MRLIREAVIVTIISALVIGILAVFGNLTQIWPMTSLGEYFYTTIAVAVIIGIDAIFKRKILSKDK